jgi:hypothetical protein
MSAPSAPGGIDQAQRLTTSVTTDDQQRARLGVRGIAAAPERLRR